MNEEIQRLARRVEDVRRSLPKSCGSYIHSELTEIRVALEKIAGADKKQTYRVEPITSVDEISWMGFDQYLIQDELVMPSSKRGAPPIIQKDAQIAAFRDKADADRIAAILNSK